MKQWLTPFFAALLCVLFVLGASAKAEEVSPILPTETPVADWVFAGIVNTEHDEQDGYFFQLQRNGQHFHVVAAIFNEQSPTPIFYATYSADIKEENSTSWQVGHAFLTFNPINESWIFGVKNSDKQGFNFKVDMLRHPDDKLPVEVLRQGMALLVTQTGRLNGHVSLTPASEETFVTAKHTWFRHVWLSEAQPKPHQLNSLLCQFYNHSALYFINLPEEDANQAFVAGLYDAKGLSVPMSQFINLRPDESKKTWKISMLSPKLTFVLTNRLADTSTVAGFVQTEKGPGFCWLSQDTLAPR